MAYSLTYTLNSDKSGYIVSGYSGTPDHVTIPNTYNSKPVLEIKTLAFKNCTTLKSIVVPNSVTKIEVAAFSGCNSIESISIPFVGEERNATGVARFFGRIFHAITAYSQHVDYIPSTLKIVNITDATALGSNSFSSCKTIERINIMGVIQTIGTYVFSDCATLKQVILPEGLNTISNYCFYNCKTLEEVHIPNSIVKIGNAAFYQCFELKSIELPLGLTNIGSSAFFNCYVLQKIVIPPNVIDIGAKAFQNCKGLKEVYLTPAIPPTAGATVFSANIMYTLYCYATDIAKYKEATNWNTLKDKIVADEIKMHFILNALNIKPYIQQQINNNKIDIKIGSTSIVNHNVANIPIANASRLGVVKVNTSGDAYTGITVRADGTLDLVGNGTARLSDAFFNNPQNYGVAVLSKDLYHWVEVGLIQNNRTLDDNKKSTINNWIGSVKQIQYSKDYNPQNGVGNDGKYYGFAYARRYDNTEFYFPIANQNYNYTIPIRDHNQNFYIGDPVQPWHCTNKRYLDSKIERFNKLVEGLTDQQINALNNFAKSLVAEA